jgi:hypothetical protein
MLKLLDKLHRIADMLIYLLERFTNRCIDFDGNVKEPFIRGLDEVE